MGDEKRKNVEPLMLAVNTVAAMLDTSGHTVRNLIAAGDLKSVRLGESVRVTRASLDAFIASGGSAPNYRERLAAAVAASETKAKESNTEKPKRKSRRKNKSDTQEAENVTPNEAAKPDTTAKTVSILEPHTEAKQGRDVPKAGPTMEPTEADQGASEPSTHTVTITDTHIVDFTNGEPKEI